VARLRCSTRVPVDLRTTGQKRLRWRVSHDRPTPVWPKAADVPARRGPDRSFRADWRLSAAGSRIFFCAWRPSARLRRAPCAYAGRFEHIAALSVSRTTLNIQDLIRRSGPRRKLAEWRDTHGLVTSASVTSKTICAETGTALGSCRPSRRTRRVRTFVTRRETDRSRKILHPTPIFVAKRHRLVRIGYSRVS